MSASGHNVVMFVRNNCARDVRVRREAATLAAAGHRVTVIALMPSRPGGLPAQEIVDGYTILRIAAPAQWASRWHDFRVRPWRARRWIGAVVRVSDCFC